MKKTLSLLLVIVMILSAFVMTSCSSPNDSSDLPSNEDDQETEKNTQTDVKNDGVKQNPEGFYSVFDEPKSSELTPPDMVNISDIAGQYKVNDKGGTNFDPLTCPYFEISGFPDIEANKNYYRMLESDSSKYPSGVAGNSQKSAGGRIRFRTNSKSMTINVTLISTMDIPHMTVTGARGIDIYTGTGSAKKYLKTIVPKNGASRYSETINLSGNATDYTLVLPLYAGIGTLQIALDKDAKIGAPTPYKYEAPVVFYGSSITHGCSASRPGTSFTDVVTRMLDANLVNLGFNGSAKGEQVVAEYIAKLEMSAFVLDYDYNATSVDELKNTHYNFYKTVRDAHPDLPIIIMTKCNVEISNSDVNAQRRAVIKSTYDKAVSEGDKNVYFIDGQYVYPAIARELCTVDGAHPTDLGMYCISQALYPVLKDVLEK